MDYPLIRLENFTIISNNYKLSFYRIKCVGIAALNHIKITMEYALQNITISYDKIKYFF